VWTRNLRAIELYKAYGFAVEGTMKRYVFLEGRHCDAHVMGRILERSATG
jgi:putative acetyltransferase